MTNDGVCSEIRLTPLRTLCASLLCSPGQAHSITFCFIDPSESIAIRFSTYGLNNNDYRLNFTVDVLAGNNMFGLGSVESGSSYGEFDCTFYVINTAF
ncbi:hypothetical protein [Enterovibrio sp. 27052020O]|uniref:hypothetical protein n=1 Tax=Enterovibrio sp. 27052020O TaxID=3241166 RepID=UPI0038908BC6